VSREKIMKEGSDLRELGVGEGDCEGF